MRENFLRAVQLQILIIKAFSHSFGEEHMLFT